MKFLKNHILYIAWIVSLASIVISLYFSNVLNFTPCILCWYQRICMYPLAIILGIGILKKDSSLFYYGFPLALIGWLISIYHNLLYYKIIPESAGPCIQGVSCTTKFIEYFGFVSIPFLSFLSFSIIIFCLWMYKKSDMIEA